MTVASVAVIDYGVGNLLSVQRALEYVGARVVCTSDPVEILAASRVVLPGVGSFSNGMHALKQLGLVSVIHDVALRGTPLLGVCLGMQLLLEESEEFGITSGLGLIPGRVIPVPTETQFGRLQKVPHIGWSALHQPAGSTGWGGTLLGDNLPGESAYFVHSYMAVPSNPANRLAECRYGGHLISAAIERNLITGCQFHPEKSGNVGLKILRRFCTD